MECIYKKPATLDPKGKSGFCPGCTYGTVVKLIAEVVEELDIRERTMLPMGVGCAVSARDWVDFDSMMSLHGRTTASGLGYKRVHPEGVTIILQGDGDAVAIGMAESVHTANRGEPVTVILVNNQIYGRTGGQMAPTTLIGQKSTTSVAGKRVEDAGYPIHMAELISTLKTPRFVARGSVHNVKEILKTKELIKKAVRVQMEENAYSFVEIITACTTNLGIPTSKVPSYIEDVVLKEFKTGVIKDESNLK